MVRRYNGVNHELLCEVVCDLLKMKGFSIEINRKNFHAAEKSGLKAYVFGKRKTGLFSNERVEATIIGQLDAETVVQIWSENCDVENRISSDLTIYFQKLEVPELVC